ncbi:MAG: YeeE/YedE family protein [Hyphomonadaceae bacterium]|jgi:uncharacterized membrane protein YedE/YeeE|nr:YeeE/YedE family protein [Hyphomonadaceae bacterium]
MLRETFANNAHLALALGGLLIGFAFGAVIYRTNYCAMGALSDIHNFNDYRRFRAWLLAAAIALLGAQLLHTAGVVALERSMYLGSSFNWFGYTVGGFVFGIGMVFAGGCPSRNLARAGGGDLRSVLTLLVLGLAAYMTIAGLVAPVRSTIEGVTAFSLGGSGQGVGDLLSALVRLPPGSARWVATVLIVAAALAYCFHDDRFRTSPVHVLSGVGVGLMVVAGWAVTGLAYDDMATRPVPPISLTYIRPVGDTLQWLSLFTATPVPGFGVTSVFGALLGAFAAATVMGRFRLATFSDAGDTVRNLLGAAMMGVGGVMALGCTVGQAVTGVSTLAFGSFVTFGAMVAGGFYGLRLLERWIMASG